MKGLIGLGLIQINILLWGWDGGQPSHHLGAWITLASVSKGDGTDAIRRHPAVSGALFLVHPPAEGMASHLCLQGQARLLLGVLILISSMLLGCGGGGGGEGEGRRGGCSVIVVAA